MGMSQRSQPLPFGHSANAAIDIEGLALLEGHLKKLREEQNRNDEDDESAWQGWDVQSNSDESFGTDRWIDVDSENDDHLSISDSDNEQDKTDRGETELDDANRISTLATTKILTPADFALLNDLRIQAATKAIESGGGSIAKRKLIALETHKKITAVEGTFMSENDILGPRKKAKSDYAERIASVEKGREGREKFGSQKGKKKKDVPSSSTNREKARNKPIMMIISSSAVRSKKKASLREKQQRLRMHIDKGKKSHH